MKGRKKLQDFYSYLEDLPNLDVEEIKLRITVGDKVEFMYIRFSDESEWVIKYKSFEAKGRGAIEAFKKLMRNEKIAEELYESLPHDFELDN